MPHRTLTKKERDFARYYAATLHLGQSYRLAYEKALNDATEASHRGAEMMTRPDVKAEVERLKAEELAQYRATAASVLRDWIKLATADPNDLVTHRRVSCQHCYAEAPQPAGPLVADPRRAPNDDCRNCHGEGVGHVFVADTDKLTGGARMLYAGVKMTRYGPEIILADQARARENIARHFGMFIEKHELFGPGGAAPMVDVTPTDPIEASKLYQRIMGPSD